MYGVALPANVISLDAALQTMMKTFDVLEDGEHYRRDFAVDVLPVRIGGRGTPEDIYGQVRDLYLDSVAGVDLDRDAEERSPELVASVRKFIETTKTSTEPFFVSWEEYPELSIY